MASKSHKKPGATASTGGLAVAGEHSRATTDNSRVVEFLAANEVDSDSGEVSILDLSEAELSDTGDISDLGQGAVWGEVDPAVERDPSESGEMDEETLSEMSTSVVNSTNTAIMSMARNIKG